MSDLPHPWSAYLRLQNKLARRRRIDDHTWGLEAGLSRILTGTIPCAEDVDRAVRSESRKERYRVQLRHAYLKTDDLTVKPIPENAFDARRHLRRIRARVSAEEWALLRAVGDGFEYKELAVASNAATGALRIRVLRLRRRLAAFEGDAESVRLSR
ncbi:MAG: hypothetical protein WB994_10450 [Candidatus Acidiferrum sp.]